MKKNSHFPGFFAEIIRRRPLPSHAGGCLPLLSLLVSRGALEQAALMIVLMELIGARGWAAGVLQRSARVASGLDGC